MQHATWPVVILELLFSAVILSRILAARAGRRLFIRRIPGLDAIDDAVGRATEMGRPILFSPGLDAITVPTIQALAIASHVTRRASLFGTRVIVPINDVTVYPVAEEVVRDAYAAEGKPEAFRSDDVRYISDRQFAYASGCVGLMNREKVAANFFFGVFFAEALILAEAGNQIGAVQIAGTPSIEQIPFFVASCDYTIIAEEFYAATAYLTREPVLLGSLVGQDWAKLSVLALVAAGMVSLLLGPAVSGWVMHVLPGGP